MKDILGDLRQPDTLAPKEHADTFRARTLEPEKQLLLAILESAVADYQKYLFATDRKKKKSFDDADNWIMGKNEELPYSFAYVCDELGFDANYIRQGLSRWKNTRTALAVEMVKSRPVRRKRRRA